MSPAWTRDCPAASSPSLDGRRSRLRPGRGELSRDAAHPTASTTASNSALSSSTSSRTVTAVPRRNSVPSATICANRRSMMSLGILKSGMPYRSRPPARSSRSKTTTECPTRVSCCAAASPAGPDPTDGNAATRALSRRLRLDESVVKGALNDRHLDLLDRYRDRRSTPARRRPRMERGRSSR